MIKIISKIRYNIIEDCKIFSNAKYPNKKFNNDDEIKNITFFGIVIKTIITIGM